MKYPLQSRGLFGRKYLDLQERVRDWQDDPQALGHEIAGEVLEVGRNVRGFQAGVDRVIVSSPPESLYDAFKVIRFGGIITFFGLHFGGKSKVGVDVNDLVFLKVSLIPTFGFDQAADTLRGIVEGTLPVIKAVMLPHG